MIAAAATGALALGVYGLKIWMRKPLYLRDPDFLVPNLPLFHDEAKARKKLLKDVSYDLKLNLIKPGSMFQGKVTVKFSLKYEYSNDWRKENAFEESLKKDLFLDFHGEGIKELVINDRVIPHEEIAFSKHRIFLGQCMPEYRKPLQYFKSSAPNVVHITFENSYVTNSAGLHKYTDPTDKQVYIYSHLEPFNCHRWFPCFDQPSIRAPLTLQVAVPSRDWTVAANASTESVLSLMHKDAQDLVKAFEIPIIGLPDEEDCRVHIFKPSPAISTYIYGLFAGPFHTFVHEGGAVPMRILASRSKHQQVNAAEMFKVTALGIKYYEEFF